MKTHLNASSLSALHAVLLLFLGLYIYLMLSPVGFIAIALLLTLF